MSLKQVHLDPFLLARLYGTPLLPATPAKRTAVGKPEKEIAFLGNNSSKITLLIYNKKQPWLPEDLFTFMTKILQACGQSMDSVALVNCATCPGINLSDVFKQLTPQRLILFGAFFRDWLEIPIKKNLIRQIEGSSCLYTDSLEELQADHQLKKNFWEALRVFFEIKK